jgi:hypothetical protein
MHRAQTFQMLARRLTQDFGFVSSPESSIWFFSWSHSRSLFPFWLQAWESRIPCSIIARERVLTRRSHSRGDFPLPLCMFFRSRKLAVLCSLGEFPLACNSGKALLGALCSRRRRQPRGFLVSQPVFLRRPPVRARPRLGRLLFRHRLSLCRPDTQQARSTTCFPAA